MAAFQSVTIPDKASPLRDDGGDDLLALQPNCSAGRILCLSRRQRLLQISDDVGGILDADREAHHVVARARE